MNISTFIQKVIMPRKQRHFLEYLPHLEKTPDNQLLYKKKARIDSRPLTELSALFTNKTAFLIGSGPSINEQDLDPIKQHATLLLNGAITLIESHQITPSAYMVVDKSFIQSHFTLLDLLPSGTPCIFTIGVIREILDKNPAFFKTHPLFFIEKATKRYNQSAITANELSDDIFTKKDDVACSLDMNKGFAEAGTVMYVAGQLMLFLNAKKITLVGFDLGNADKPRFYERQQNKVKSGLKKAINNRIIPSFELLSNLCKRQNIKLTNASHISSMPYDIIPYDNVLMPERDKPDND